MASQDKIRLVFLVRSLDLGGAQRQLVTLAKAIDKTRFDVSIVTFYSGFHEERELENVDIKIVCLKKRGRWDLLSFARRLIKTSKELQPHILHGYLDIPNVLALAMKRFVKTRVVWGVRASALELKQYDWLFRVAARVERSLSNYPDLVIANSNAAVQHYLGNSFPENKLKLIPNGIDTAIFKPDPEARATIRMEWDIADSTKLVGVVGRFDPVKNLPLFFEAAVLVSRELPDAQFVCVGEGPADYVNELKKKAAAVGISEKLIWSKPRADVTSVYNGLDVLVSPSLAESFPNVLAEAMACGVPCVASDVGDSRQILGQCGAIVPAAEPEILARAIITALREGRRHSAAARVRIIENFSIDQLARRTEAALLELV
jgi:glycosyltransferase involved in cell wall biosynthesis